MKSSKKVIIYSLTLTFYCVFFQLNLFAQKPDWIDYNKRVSMYPSSEYLVSFVSGKNTDNSDVATLIEKYENLARSEVARSIYVSIQSKNTLDISNINGNTNEEFLSKSILITKAKINGLRTDHYYDRKKEIIYALAYVNIKKLVFYYKNIIDNNLTKVEQKIDEGKNYLKNDNKQDALRSFYEAMPILSEIEEAELLLTALEKYKYVSLYSKRIHDAKIEINKEIYKLQKSEKSSIGETAYFVAYGLYIQLKELKNPIAMELFTYKNTGLTSIFSIRWNSELVEALRKTGLKNIRKYAGNDSFSILGGNFWVEGNLLKIHAVVLQNGKIIAVSEGSIPLSLLKEQEVDFIPLPLLKLKELKGVRLDAINPNGKFKIGKASEEPLRVQVSKETDGIMKAARNVPVLFVEKHSGKILCKGKSDGKGVALGYLPALKYNKPVLEIEAIIDIAKFTGIDTNTIFYKTYKSDILPANFKLKAEHQLYYINSDEKLNNYPMEIKMIEPVIKQYLSDNDYHFTNSRSEADKIINIKANTTAATYINGIWFSYIDASLSVIDNSNNEEVFKTILEQVKGAGANKTKAGKKAYTTASKMLKDKLAEYLKGNN